MGKFNPKHIRLIQRLLIPRSMKSSVPSFGGGPTNGGLTKEAMDLLENIFDFDYMGAAEFEWGAVPQALQNIAIRASEFVSYELLLERTKILHSSNRDMGFISKGGFPPIPVTSVTVYVLCSKKDRCWVTPFIRKLARNPYKMGLKETPMLSQALDPIFPKDHQYGGWLELYYGFMFFINKEMFEKTLGLFGLTIGNK